MPGGATIDVGLPRPRLPVPQEQVKVRKGKSRTVTLATLQRRMRAGTTVVITVRKGNTLGKYIRLRFRRGQRPRAGRPLRGAEVLEARQVLLTRRTVTVAVVAALGFGAGAQAQAPTGQPVNRALPVVTQSGSTLTTTDGAWVGDTRPYTYEWLRCADATPDSCIVVPGQTASTYPMTGLDAGARLRSRVTASNPLGSRAAVSEPTRPGAGLRAHGHGPTGAAAAVALPRAGRDRPHQRRPHAHHRPAGARAGRGAGGGRLPRRVPGEALHPP